MGNGAITRVVPLCHRGRMENDKTRLRTHAIELRRQGKSRTDIKKLLGVTDWAVTELLNGLPPQDPGLRTQAKDDQRKRARELRLAGKTYPEIAEEIGVSKSSLSLWLRDLPVPEKASTVGGEEGRVRRTAGIRASMARRQERIEDKRQGTKQTARLQIGEINERELLLAGALIYWCEGEKDKPYRRQEAVNFINSDPGLLRLFLRFLDLVGIAPTNIRYRVHIHETAGVEAVTEHWMAFAGVERSAFDVPNIKRHNPKTVRKNTGEDYRGCLQIRVRKSAELYRRIDGWAHAAMGIGIVGFTRDSEA